MTMLEEAKIFYDDIDEFGVGKNKIIRKEDLLRFFRILGRSF